MLFNHFSLHFHNTLILRITSNMIMFVRSIRLEQSCTSHLTLIPLRILVNFELFYERERFSVGGFCDFRVVIWGGYGQDKSGWECV